MAVVQGIKERVHSPLYDSLTVDAEKQLRDVESSSTFKFFINVQGKNKLETNLQSASLLPHYNTYEARAMRVIISDLPPVFSDEHTASDEDYEVLDDEDRRIDSTGQVEGATGSTFNAAKVVTANIKIGLNRLIELLKEAKESEDGWAGLGANDEEVELIAADNSTPDADAVAEAGGTVWLNVSDIQYLIDKIQPERAIPPKFQIDSMNGNGSSTLISKLIYNTVTTFFVGEKIMIQAPTWFFPGGAGPFSDQVRITTHGVPSPVDTFRFAEPIFIDKQQNFRVEIEIPDADTLKEFQRIYGPLFVWVVIDGYMTRDVQ